MTLLNKFQKGTIAHQNKEYGIVTRINVNSDRPITITWDSEPNEPFAYTLDEIKVLKISPVPLYRPKQTLVNLPAKSTPQLFNGQDIQLDSNSFYLVDSVDDEQISICSDGQVYHFPLATFPGIPVANLIELPINNEDKLSASSLMDLTARVKVWLAINMPSQFLEIINIARIQHFQQQFIVQLEQSYSQDDLETAWQIAWSSYLRERIIEEGLYRWKIGSQVLRYVDGQIIFGKIQSIQIESLRSWQIEWEDKTITDYSLLELKSLQIKQILPLTFLSSNLAYQMSEDGSYFKVCLAFRTKKLAQAWLRPIKRIIGSLSHLRDYQQEDWRHIPDKRWEYELDKPRHKTTAKRLAALQKIALLDLEKPPGLTQKSTKF